MAKVYRAKIPPQNIEAEAAVLGAALVNKEVMDKVADVLVDSDFYRTDHQIIYRAVLRLYDKRAPIDLVTLTNELESLKQIDQIGGAAYLAELVNSVPTAIHVAHYAEIVKQKSVLRKILGAGQKISELGYDEEKEVNQILDEAEKALFDVSHKEVKDNFMPISDILASSFDRIDRLHREKGVLRGVTSGFREMDNKLSGLQPSDLVILAARPSMGKCVAGDTRVINPKTGELNTIENIVKRQTGEIATLDDWQFQSVKPSGYLNDGVKPTFKVTTALGHEITATLPHPFLTIEGWKHLAQIAVGERIAVAKNEPFYGNLHLNENRVKLLAYFISDGTTREGSPQFTNVTPEVVADFVQAVELFGGVGVHKKLRSNRTDTYVVTTDHSNQGELKQEWASQFGEMYMSHRRPIRQAMISANVSLTNVAHWKKGATLPSAAVLERIATYYPEFTAQVPYDRTNPLTAYLAKSGLWNKTAHHKAIPSDIFTLSKSQLALFLNRLFACDGTACVTKTGLPIISYGTVSKVLAEQVQHLLRRFGILAKLRIRSVKYAGTRRTSYEVDIRAAEDLLTFVEEIGILGKEQKLAAVREVGLKRKKGWTKDTLPMAVWNRIALLKGERSWVEIGRLAGLDEGHNFHPYKRQPRRETVLRFAEVFKDEELKKIATSDIYWDKVTKIEPAGCQPVYDLTVEDTHNFLANDFVVHNTTFALNIALNAAVKGKTAVGFFSLEQSKEQIVDKLLCSQAMVDGWKLRTGNLNEDDFPAIGMAMGTLAEAPIFIDDSPILTPIEIRTRARRLKADQNLGLIIVDYLQLITSNSSFGSSESNRVQQVSEISRQLKALARELDVPVMALSQLSRAVESRDKKIPQLSDLRESGSIEQDADVVMFLYREDYYEKDTERKGMTDVLIRKHRNGPIGEFELHFRPEQSRFFDVERKAKPVAK